MRCFPLPLPHGPNLNPSEMLSRIGERTNLGPFVTPEEAAARRNLLIKPTDADWQLAHEKFTSLLDPSSKMTINQLLKLTFTSHEARMFVPSDRPDTRSIQESNTERFHKLRSGRFSAVDDSLATKLTMMYFGLPVEPMASPLDELAKETKQKPSEGPLYNVTPPLHFLTAHNHRNWGNDGLRGQEAPIHPVPLPGDHGGSTRLRGGELSPERETGPEGEPRPERAPLAKVVDYVPEGEERFKATDKWTKLFGLKGYVPFVPTKWKSFSDAVRALLSVRASDDTKLQFSLVRYDKKNRQVRYAIDDFLPLTKDSPSMNYLSHHWGTKDSHEDCCEYLVKVGPESKAATDKVGEVWLDDVLNWLPYPDQLKVDLLQIVFPVFNKKEDPSGAIYRCAWLAFPKTKKDKKFSVLDYGANQYNMHLKTAIEVLVGRPEGDFHHALFRVHDLNNPEASRPNHFVYGGMTQHTSIWERMNPQTNPHAVWILQRRRLKQDQIAVVVPHYYPPHVPIIKKDDIDGALLRIRQLMASAYTAHDLRKMDRVKLSPGKVILGMEPSWTVLIWLKYRNPKFQKIPEELDVDSEAEGEGPYVFSDDDNDDNVDDDDKDNEYYDPNECATEYDYVSTDEDEEEIEDRQCQEARIHPTDFSLRGNDQSVPPDTRDDGSRFPLPLLDEERGDARELLQEFLKVEQKVILLTPDWHTVRARYAPGWVEDEVGSRTTIGRPPFREAAPNTTIVSDFEQIINRMCDRAKHPRISYDNRVICLQSAWPEDSSHDNPMVVVNGDALPSHFRGIHTSLTSSYIRVTFKRPKAGNWKKSISSSNVWGPRVITGKKAPFRAQRTDKLTEDDLDCGCSERVRELPASDDEDDDFLAEGRRRGRQRSSSPPQAYSEPPPELPERLHAEDEPRASSWFRQPSAFDNHLGPRVPTSAPPKEHFLRTSRNLPMVSKSVLTGTDVDRLAGTLWNERGAYLGRQRICPYAYCDFKYKLNDPAAIEKHLRERHRSSKCLWCDIPMFEHWNYEEKMKHLRTHHRPQLLHALEDTGQTRGGTSATFVPTEPPRLFPSDGRCRLYFVCGTNVRGLDDREFVEHMHDWHQDYLDHGKSIEELRRDWVDAGKPVDNRKGKGKQLEVSTHSSPSRATPVGPSTHEEGTDEEEGTSSVQKVSRNVTIAQSTKQRVTQQKAPKRTREPSVQQEDPSVEIISSGSSSLSSEESEEERPAKRSRVSREPAETLNPGSDRRASKSPRGRPAEKRGKRKTDSSAGGRYRRSPSPDWNDLLGPEDPNFEPGEDMYCSRCLRKAPRYHDQSPGRSVLGRSKEMEFHHAKDRSCRIRRGVGVPEALPNRSGWVSAADLPSRITKMKDNFLKWYPAYVQTIYPTRVSDTNTTVWRSDPNNEINKLWWDIPWPPYDGQPPFPGDWKFPGYPEVDGTGRKRRREYRGIPLPYDPNYQYETDHDSDDDLPPDVDDTKEFQEESENGGDGARGSSRTPTKKWAVVESVDTEDSEATSAEPSPTMAKTKKAVAEKPAAKPVETGETSVKATPKKTAKKVPAAESLQTEQPVLKGPKKTQPAKEAVVDSTENDEREEEAAAEPAPKKTKKQAPVAKKKALVPEPVEVEDTPSEAAPKKKTAVTKKKAPAPKPVESEDTPSEAAPKTKTKKAPLKKAPLKKPVTEPEDEAEEDAPAKPAPKTKKKTPATQSIKTEEEEAAPAPKKPRQTKKKAPPKEATSTSADLEVDEGPVTPEPKQTKKRQRATETATATATASEAEVSAGPSTKKVKSTGKAPRRGLKELPDSAKSSKPTSAVPTRASSRIRARQASVAASAQSKK
ncbi:hypothetical protein QQX98_004297 [Neonectria punicea]|uniref:C2H2-type domain-containing protein n=1 Tax=Neonectria punicea TaxID=979145 RepID=A0ABR1H9K2_9HYPO